MSREVIIQFGRFILLVLLQGLVFINVDVLDGRMQSYIYILFILLLPLRTPPILTMSIAFILGLSVDVFYNSLGVHASACVLIGFIRSRVLELLAPRDGYDLKDRPTVGSLGVGWFIQYSFLLIVIHHLWLFMIEAMSLQGILSTLGKVFLTTILTFVMLLIGQFLFHSPKRETT